MKRAARIALFALLLAALPLRGYASALIAFCDEHHGGAAAAQEHAHENGDDHHHASSDSDGGNGVHAASVCSICASCCAGAGLAVQLIQEIVFQPPGTIRIPFLGHQASAFVADRLDRPPLPL